MRKKNGNKTIKQSLKKHWPWMFCGIMIFLSELFRLRWMFVFLHSAMNSWLAVETKLRSFFKKKQNQI